MASYQERLRIGKRDKFWLSAMLFVIVVLFVLRMLSHDGFSDSGRVVWKSANFGSNEQKDTVLSGHVHASQKSSVH
jgi:hypothetical protein